MADIIDLCLLYFLMQGPEILKSLYSREWRQMDPRKQTDRERGCMYINVLLSSTLRGPAFCYPFCQREALGWEYFQTSHGR